MGGAEVRIRRMQSVQTQNMFDLTIAGNTVGAGGILVSSGTLTLVGGNNITLSQNGGNAITISGGAGGAGASFDGGVSNLGNTLGTTGTVSNRIVFAGGDNITLSQSINGQSATVTISGASQSIQTQSIIRDVLISGNTSGTTEDISSGTLTLVGGNRITLSQVGNAITISGPALGGSTHQHVIDGNTSGTITTMSSGILTLAGGNNITLSQVGNAVTISGASTSQSVQTQSIVRDIVVSGNTSGTTEDISSGTLTLAGGQSITLSQVGNAVTISGASTSQSVQTQNVVDVTISGNTSGISVLVSSGTLTLAGGNSITLSQVGNAITISGATTSQSIQTQSTHVHIISGNTSGTTASMSTGTIVLAGGNNITLSQDANSVTVSALASSSLTHSGNVSISTNGSTITISGLGFAYASLSAGNTSGTSTLISSGTMYLAGGNSITLSQNGNSITISGATTSQSVQTQNVVDVTLSGNTSGTLALVSSGTLTLAGGNNITLSQVGNAITISAFNQSAQPTMSGGISTDGNTAGTTGTVSGQIIFVAPNIGNDGSVTLSQSINGQSATISIIPRLINIGISTFGNTAGTIGRVNRQYIFVGGNNISLSQSIDINSATLTINAFNQSVQTQNVVDVTISGNTSGTSALVSSGTLTLAGGNNITLSQVGNAITISGGTVAGAAFSIGVSNIGNTLGSTGTVSQQMVLVGGNNITLSQSTNGNSATITISAFNQSVQTQNLVDITLSGNTSGTLALISSGTLTLAGGNNITLSQAGGNAVTISAASQSIQTQSIIRDVLISGNTSGTTADITSGTLILAGGNSITLSQNGNSVTISGATTSQSVQTQNVVDVTLSGNTTGTLALVSSGTLTLAGGQSITLSQVGNAVTISGASTSQSVQTQSIVRGVVIGGNTSGTTASITSGTLILAGGNNITISQAGGNAITISAPEIPDFGVSNVGNTSGVTGTVNAQLILAGGNNITVSQSTNGQLATVTISAARGIILVSNSLVTASAQVLSFTGANVTDNAYTFHLFISNPLAANPIYSVMFNGNSLGISRRYMTENLGNVSATSDNNAYAFNLGSSQNAHNIIHMMFHTSFLRLIGVGNEIDFHMNQQTLRQTDTGATNVTAIIISANQANAIGPNSRIIWYKHG